MPSMPHASGVASSQSPCPSPIRVVRRLAAAGEPLVQVGDRVEAETALLAMSTFPGKVMSENMARQLRVSPDETGRYLLHPEGTMLTPGQVLGRSSMFWHHRVAYAANEGSVAGVSPSLGVVYLREHIPTQIAETVRVDIIDELRGDKNSFSSYLNVKDGDKVERGHVLATRKEGFKYHNVTSPVHGTVSAIAPLLGSLSIIPDRVSSVLIAHVPGIVLAITGGREVELAGYGVVLEGLLGIGGEARGLLSVMPNAEEPWRPPSGQKGDLEGCVVVTGNADHVSLQEAARLGVTGLIAGQMHQSEVSKFLGRELGGIATGDEEVSPVLILTGGFGAGGMAASLHARFRALEGKLASINGTTHIRAGVIRPRVVVSFPVPEGSDPEAADGATMASADGREHARESRGLAVKARVRVLRGPWAGRTGVILGLPVQPQPIPTGSSVLVAKVRIDPRMPGDDSPEAIVAQANLQREEPGE